VVYIGDSGQGTYHGKASFDCFSRHKSVLACSTLIDPLDLINARYSKIDINQDNLSRLYRLMFMFVELREPYLIEIWMKRFLIVAVTAWGIEYCLRVSSI